MVAPCTFTRHTPPMRIGIIEAGLAPGGLSEHHRYDAMVRDLLGAAHEYRTYRAYAGELPAVGADEALVVTGSPAGVYDPLPWIAPLANRLRAAVGTPTVGICFGHQVLAHALGGTVAKAPQGWGVGLHRYEVAAARPGLPTGPLDVIVSHQDQVLAPPSGADVIGGSGFSPNGLLAYRDRPAISCQCHPEFTPAFARALLEVRRPADLPEAQRLAAIASLAAPNDSAVLRGWIEMFLAGEAA